MEQPGIQTHPSHTWTIVALALLSLIVHLAANAFGG